MTPSETPLPPTRSYIGKPSEPTPPERPLQEILPENPETLTHKELYDRFMLLALRCFNKENQLLLSTELNKNYEKVVNQLRHELRLKLIDLDAGLHDNKDNE